MADGWQNVVAMSGRNYQWSIEGIEIPSLKEIQTPQNAAKRQGQARFCVVIDEDSLRGIRDEHAKVLSCGPNSLNQHPLSNLRFGLKDIFDVKGLRTSVGSRAWYSYHKPCQETSIAVQMLLDQGANLVGKTKNTQFANGEDLQEWIDYTCPWNPRGDGYQNPDTSSSGSAAAVASYEWLDFAPGSDTCGSIACPASSQGLFAIRFTTGSFPSAGIFHINERLDSIGLFTRSIDLLYHVSSVWGLQNQINPKVKRLNKPSKILYPWSLSPHDNPYIMQALEKWFDSIEAFTGVKMTKIDIEEEWERDDPSKEESSIKKWLEKTTAHLHLSGFENATRAFRESYRAEMGKAPYFDPVNTWKSELGEKITKHERLEMTRRQDTFKEWFGEKLSKDPLGEEGPLNAIMV